MNNQTKTYRLMGVIVILAILWYKNRHRSVNTAYSGQYSNSNVYHNVSPMKHDMFKQVTIDISALLILGLISPLELWNNEDPYNSILGKSFMTILGYAVFYQLVQPYFVNYLPNF